MLSTHNDCEEVVQTINCSSHITHIIMTRVLKEYFCNQPNEICTGKEYDGGVE